MIFSSIYFHIKQRVTCTDTDRRHSEAVEALISMNIDWESGNVQKREFRPLTPSSDACEDSVCSVTADLHQSSFVRETEVKLTDRSRSYFKPVSHTKIVF